MLGSSHMWGKTKVFILVGFFGHAFWICFLVSRLVGCGSVGAIHHSCAIFGLFQTVPLKITPNLQNDAAWNKQTNKQVSHELAAARKRPKRISCTT